MRECSACGRLSEDTASAGRCEDDGAAVRPGLPGPLLLDGRYLLLRRLGTGGMGSVFEARHVVLDRLVAVKVLHVSENPSAQSRFRVEAQALGRLDHPGIVKVIDYGVEALGRGIPYLVMERLEGETLEARRSRLGRIPLAEALPILQAVASAVDAAHRDGILHRDLKPANVFLSGPIAPGESLENSVRVLDFGVAHLGHGIPESGPDRSKTMGKSALPEHAVALTDADVIVGTAAYLSPERTWGDPASPASDIYALGILAFEILTGQKPFRGGGVEELLLAHSTQPAPAPSAVCPDLPKELDEPLLRALAKVPFDRPGTATEFVSGLREALVEKSALNRRAADRRERPRLIARALAGSLALGISGLLLSTLGPLRRADDAFFQNLMLIGPRGTVDPRLVIAELGDDWLAADTRPLAAQAELVAQATERLFAAGARSVALDMLLPGSWADSPAFSTLVTRRSKALTLAALATPEGKIVGPECIGGHVVAVLGEDSARRLFGFVNLELASPGFVRRAPRTFLDIEGRKAPAWAFHAANLVDTGLSATEGETDYLIDYRIPASAIPRFSLADLESSLAQDPRLVAGKLVLVGATFAGSGDQHRIPGEPLPRPGVEVQALGAATLLSSKPPRPISRVATLAACAALAGITFAGAFFPKGARLLAGGASVLLGVFASVLVFSGSGFLLPVTVLALSPAFAMILSSFLFSTRKPTEVSS